MKSIIINGRFLTQEFTGVQRAAKEIVTAIDNLIEKQAINTEKYQIAIVTPKNIKQILPLKHIIHKTIGTTSGHFWEQFELPSYLNNALLVNLCNTGPLTYKKQVVTIYDASVFDTPFAYSFAFRNWYRFLIKKLARNSMQIITSSAFSKTSLARNTKIPEDKIKIIPLGKEHILSVSQDNSILTKYGLNNKPFLLAVSSLNINKNFQAIIKAVDLLQNNNIELVVAGGKNSKVFNNSDPIFLKQVKYIGRISDLELKALYEHAICFIYPSKYEGFGLPPLEAMACGCPVIVSKAASLPEVCNNSALYCDPDNPNDIAEKIQAILSKPELSEKLQLQGLEQAKKFSWEKCAREYLEVIKETLDNI